MSNKPHIALLPGLDGTGELFFPIIPFLEAHFEVHVVQYKGEVTFNDYVVSAAKQLPSNVAVSLVAESFSGPIAISLLANKNLGFGASVLSATFCKSPLPLLTQLSKYMPEKLFTSNFASKAFMNILVTGRGANSEVRNKILALLNQVSPSQFQSRIGLVNDVDVTEGLKEIKVPLLYIQATKDRIVWADSGNEIRKHVKNMEMVKVDGAHMILQTQPEICAELIINHVITNRQ